MNCLQALGYPVAYALPRKVESRDRRLLDFRLVLSPVQRKGDVEEGAREWNELIEGE